MPSVQSRLTGSIKPYSSCSGWAFGFRTNIFTVTPSAASRAFFSVSRTSDLPPPVGPTIIVVWRTICVSYIWMHLSTWLMKTSSSVWRNPRSSRSATTASFSAA